MGNSDKYLKKLASTQCTVRLQVIPGGTDELDLDLRWFDEEAVLFAHLGVVDKEEQLDLLLEGHQVNLRELGRTTQALQVESLQVLEIELEQLLAGNDVTLVLHEALRLEVVTHEFV